MGRIGNDPTSGYPWWVGAIYKVGVPTAIAVYLVWFLANRVQNNLEAVTSVVTQHMQDQRVETESHRKELQILRAICVQGAKNVIERNACFE